MAVPNELWVLLKHNDDSAVVNHAVLVSTKDCHYVAHFIDAIKKKLSNELGTVAVNHITLHVAVDSPALRPGLALAQIPSQPGYRRHTDESPLFVSVPPPARAAPISARRHIDYKQSKAFTSSRSFLTSIALELAKIYPLKMEKTLSGNEKPLTFGTIIYNSHKYNPDPLPQFRNKFKKLHDIFTPDEWYFLDGLNDAANGHFHRPLNPGLSTKQLVLPSDFSGEAAICKIIATKSNVVANASDLIVYNEGSGKY